MKTDCITKTTLEEKGNFLIIDVRTEEERAGGFIKNSVHIPIDELGDRLSELPNADVYVTACGKGGGRSIEGAEILKKNNYTSFWLCGGTFGWIGEN